MRAGRSTAEAAESSSPASAAGSPPWPVCTLILWWPCRPVCTTAWPTRRCHSPCTVACAAEAARSPAAASDVAAARPHTMKRGLPLGLRLPVRDLYLTGMTRLPDWRVTHVRLPAGHPPVRPAAMGGEGSRGASGPTTQRSGGLEHRRWACRLLPGTAAGGMRLQVGARGRMWTHARNRVRLEREPRPPCVGLPAVIGEAGSFGRSPRVSPVRRATIAQP